MYKPNRFRGIHNTSLKLRRKILRILVENRRVGNHNLDTNDTRFQLLCSKPRLLSALSALEASGFVKLIYAKDCKFEELNDGDIVGIELTDKGNAYFEQLSDKRRQFIMNSVIIPILVSIITAFITVYILPSLGIRAQLWLSGTSQSQPQSLQDSPPTCAPSDNP